MRDSLILTPVCSCSIVPEHTHTHTHTLSSSWVPWSPSNLHLSNLTGGTYGEESLIHKASGHLYYTRRIGRRGETFRFLWAVNKSLLYFRPTSHYLLGCVSTWARDTERQITVTFIAAGTIQSWSRAGFHHHSDKARIGFVFFFITSRTHD